MKTLDAAQIQEVSGGKKHQGQGKGHKKHSNGNGYGHKKHGHSNCSTVCTPAPKPCAPAPKPCH